MTEPEPPHHSTTSRNGPDPEPVITAGENVAERPSAWRERLSTTLMVLIVVALVWVVLRNRDVFVDTVDRVGPGGVVLSLLAGLVGVGTTGLQWRAVLRGMGVEFTLPDALRVFFVSQLGKYLPGSVWPIVVQLEAAKERGARRRTVFAANLVTLATGMAGGLVLAAVTLPFAYPDALRRYWWALAATPLIVVIALPRSLPWVLDKALVAIGREPLQVTMTGAGTVTAVLWALVSWVFLGLHLFALSAALTGTSPGLVVLCLGGMSLAVCAGILFIPSPAGAGLREVVLVFVLSAVMTAGQAVAVAVASRVVLILVDAVLAASGYLYGRLAGARPSSAAASITGRES